MKFKIYLIVFHIILLSFIPIHAQVSLDGTIGNSGTIDLKGPDFDIRPEYGHLAGTNLFHSFQSFNIGENESAAFRGPAFVENIISRVTGGEISLIAGTLRSAISGADLYFLNPAGVMFGPNANLDVSGSFHVSTADYLKMGGNEKFYSMPHDGELLSISEPSAFGFLDNTIEPIVFDSCNIEFPGETLSIIGGDIRITAADITNQKGRLNLMSAASPGEIRLFSDETGADVSSLANLGNINIIGNDEGEKSEIYVRQNSIFIRAGQFIADNSNIFADISFSLETRSSSVFDIQADTVEIRNGTHLSTDTFGKTNGPDITIRAKESLDIADSEIRIGSVNFTASGNAGKLSLLAKDVILSNTNIKSESKDGSTGKAGDVNIAATESITMTDSVIDTFTTGTGNAGTVKIEADTVSLKEGTEIQAYTLGKGSAGKIFIAAGDSISLEKDASVNTETFHQGEAGEIELKASRIQFSDTASVSSSSKSEYKEGQAGTIIIRDGGSVSLQDDSSLRTKTQGPAKAGDIFITNIKNLQIEDNASISSASGKDDSSDDSGRLLGDAGTISINVTDSIRLFGSGSVTTDAESSGGGEIVINAKNTVNLKGGLITSSVSMGTEGGGDISIGNKDTQESPAFVILQQGQIRANADEGDGGAIFIITDNYIKSPDSVVDASSKRGNDGTIDIETPDTDVTGSLTTLPSQPLDAGKWIVTPCARRTIEDISRFVIKQRDGLPMNFDDILAVGSELLTVNNEQHRLAAEKGDYSEIIRLLEKEEPNLENAPLLSYAYMTLGHFQKAAGILNAVLPLAEQSKYPAQKSLFYSSFGDLLLILDNMEGAITYTKKSLKEARQSDNRLIIASVLNNLGNLRIKGRNYSGALQAYKEAFDLAENSDIKSKLLINTARTQLAMEEYQDAAASIKNAVEQIENQPDTFNKAANLISLSLTALKIGNYLKTEIVEDREQWLTQAAAIGETIENSRIISCAYGYLGQYYEDTQQVSDALKMTGKAIFFAGQGYFPEILYRWQWQMGRLLKNENTQQAFKFYQSAIDTLNPIRMEFFTGFRETKNTFETDVKPLYTQLAQLLMEQPENNNAETSDFLACAGDTMEMLKKAELQDFYRDECLETRQTEETKAKIPAKTAVIYPILLPDHLSLLLIFHDSMKQIKVQVTAEKLKQTAKRLRENLESWEENYKDDAKQLYDWLIRPAQNEFISQNIDTLIIVPDSSLSLIPFAALHSGEHFLIEEYAMGTVPSLKLTNTRQTVERRQILLNGLSEAREGFVPLKNVRNELEYIGNITESKIFIDKDFTTANLEKEMQNQDYDILHLATHAVFGDKPEDTFLLTYDGRLTLDGLERLMGLKKYQEKQLDMLTLSACETAAGNERAAFGLAGVAIRAGAKSALATLWKVDDAAASQIIKEFYAQYMTTDISKAKALQNAQKKLIRQKQFEHPVFWAPFLMIGNWM
ncbi:Filamentous hemagglutinin family N-terminal domain-containing protein, CHAT domain-containing [Desulfonema limicola]|uniref:Filamentous hemagglutinin family N-terminal domain-containing protein, CHAT domain-containing n=1 Tax=Desulfonema limicola TaxID=45656 RepID=A0A975GE56_9BACT|nr:CHAT domain-containing protein [Desulfonema limicola]QTA77906.1 Filamentous hemagglutinin family N-terminal domain-containing protein, CHAT domain-containing [Desulfonema limicola]